MGGTIRAILGLAWLTNRTLFTGKRALVVSLVALLPPLVVGVLAVTSRQSSGSEAFHGIAFDFSLRFMIYLMPLVFGIALTAGEIEDGTAVYIYLGSIPRWLIVLVQAAMATAALSLLMFASLLLAAVLAASPAFADPLPNLWRTVTAYGLVAGVGIAIATAFYMTCGLTFRRPLIPAVIATFFWEIVVTGVPVRLAAYTLTNNLRVLLLYLVFHGEPGHWFRYVKNYDLPGYDGAALFLSCALGIFLAAAMLIATNRSIEGREAR